MRLFFFFILTEKCYIHYRQKIGCIQQGTDYDNTDCNPAFNSIGALQQIPFAQKTCCWWYTNHGQTAYGKGRHGPWHAPAYAIQLTDLRLVRSYIYRPCRKEQSVLCVVTYIDPAAKNSVILPKACTAIWMAAARMETGVRMAAAIIT